MNKTKLANIPTKLYNVTNQNDYSHDVDTYNHITADIPYMHILNENTEHRVYTNKIVQEALNEAQYISDTDVNATAYKHILRDGTANSNIATANANNSGIVSNIANNGNVTTSSYNKSIVVRNNYTGEISYVNDKAIFRSGTNIKQKGSESTIVNLGYMFKGSGGNWKIPVRSNGKWRRYLISRYITPPDLIFFGFYIRWSGSWGTWCAAFARKGDTYTNGTGSGTYTLTYANDGNVTLTVNNYRGYAVEFGGPVYGIYL